jgi:di/tricarboxylate transporter
VSDAAITLIVLGVAVVLFIANRLPVGVVALGAALALYAFGVIDADQAFAGFGSQTIIFIAALFVVSEALDATGVTTWAGQRIIAAAGGKRTRLVVSLLVLVALLTALVTPNGSVAALLPMTVVVALRAQLTPSKLLIPLAFAAHAGSLLVLTGSPVNVLVAESSAAAGVGTIGFFDFALIGIPLVIATVAVLALLGDRLLPERQPQSMPTDLSDHARTLAHEYRLAEHAHIRGEVPQELFDGDAGVAEVVVPPRSPLVGQSTFPGQVTDSGDLVVVAVQRAGEAPATGEITLAPGDVLLLEGRWDALDRHLVGTDEVLAVHPPAAIRRQVLPLGPGARPTLAILALMVAGLSTGLAPAAICGAAAASAIVALGVLTPDQAYRSISWSTIVLLGGMLPVSGAIQSSGAADDIAGLVVDLVGTSSPLLLLAGLFIVTSLFGQAISNTATALIVIPIALSAASELDISAKPVLISVAVASAGAFLTPIATPANMMVLGPGGYRFGDYWRLGLVMIGLFFLAAVLLVPLIWPF